MFKKNKINEEKEPLLQEVEQLEGQNSYYRITKPKTRKKYCSKI